MLGYRKKAFARAHGLLSQLRSDPDDIDRLRALQQLLVREIQRAEAKVRKIKADLSSAHDSTTESNRSAISRLRRQLEGVRQCAYIFRCFGDAIAFLYLDKHALKQTFYNTGNANPKQTAGFLSGKAGFVDEILALESILAAGVPALLTDLTNTIRHGDICVLIGPDPQLIEVKSSSQLDARGKKQRRALSALHSFFETDIAESLRGFSKIIRGSYGSPERHYGDEVNSCVAEARRAGFAQRSPERGLHYLVGTRRRERVLAALDSLTLRSPWLFLLNEFKAERAWAPYSPFTLSLIGWDELWSFIKGEVVVLVVVDLEALCEIALRNGCTSAAVTVDGPDPVLTIESPSIPGTVHISRAHLARIGFEFVSPEWVVQSAIETISGAYGSSDH